MRCRAGGGEKHHGGLRREGQASQERGNNRWLNGGVLTASLFLICTTFSLERSLGRSEGGGDGQQGTPISRLGPVLGSEEGSLMAAVVVGMKRKQG